MPSSLALRLAGVATLTCVALACSSSEYDEDWGGDLPSDGRADGLGDDAIPIEFGQTRKGTVDEQSLVLYRIKLTKGDELTATMRRTKGDLSPDLALFFGLTSNVKSATFKVKDAVLTKTYVIGSTGAHFFAARAFQNKGAGSFEVTLECTGGPCDGEFEPELLSVEDADSCIARARKCAFKEMAQFGGDVGPARAASLFDGCLNMLGTEDGSSCSSACDDPDDDFASKPSDVCESVVAQIPFYADQKAACLAEVDSCLEDCTDLADGSIDDIFDAGFSRCWTFGFNGTCPSYARDHEACGGALEDGTSEQCHERCESIDGAWSDDLDDICDLACE